MEKFWDLSHEEAYWRMAASEPETEGTAMSARARGIVEVGRGAEGEEKRRQREGRRVQRRRGRSVPEKAMIMERVRARKEMRSTR